MTFKHIKTEELAKMYMSGSSLKEVAAHFKISYWTVLDRMKKAGIKKNVRHTVNHDLFGKFTKESCYWAGFIAADGSIHKTDNRVEVELSAIDVGHLRKLCRFAGRDEKLWFRNKELNCKIFKMAAVSLVSKQIQKDLKNNFSLIPNKTLVLESPDEMPQEFNSHYIRGYVDGDGSIGWHKHNNRPRVGVTSGSIKILEWILNIWKKETNTCHNLSILKRKNINTYSVSSDSQQSYKILDWLYRDSNDSIRLDRKYKKYIQYTQETK